MAGTLHGRTALVTGASSGIGAATARALAAQGATVVLAARRLDRLHALQEELEADGARASVVELDVSSPPSCQDAVETVHDRFGRLDILVNAAGVMTNSSVLDADWRDWEQMLRVNVLGLMVLTQAALPMLLEARGAVVQVSSAAGRRVGPGAAGYGASKFAVTAFSEALRQEVTALGVRVVVVEPGFVDTDMVATAPPEMQERARAIRMLHPEDVAAAVVYAVTQPPHVAVNEILVRPTEQIA